NYRRTVALTLFRNAVGFLPRLGDLPQVHPNEGSQAVVSAARSGEPPFACPTRQPVAQAERQPPASAEVWPLTRTASAKCPAHAGLFSLRLNERRLPAAPPEPRRRLRAARAREVARDCRGEIVEPVERKLRTPRTVRHQKDVLRCNRIRNGQRDNGGIVRLDRELRNERRTETGADEGEQRPTVDLA